jgi:hypothetical protein
MALLIAYIFSETTTKCTDAVELGGYLSNLFAALRIMSDCVLIERKSTNVQRKHGVYDVGVEIVDNNIKYVKCLSISVLYLTTRSLKHRLLVNL